MGTWVGVIISSVL